MELRQFFKKFSIDKCITDNLPPLTVHLTMYGNMTNRVRFHAVQPSYGWTHALGCVQQRGGNVIEFYHART